MECEQLRKNGVNPANFVEETQPDKNCDTATSTITTKQKMFSNGNINLCVISQNFFVQSA